MKKLLLLLISICIISIVNAIPKITSFSPTSGKIGTTVIITGTGFSSIPSENIVKFGAIKVVVIYQHQQLYQLQSLMEQVQLFQFLLQLIS